VDSRPETNERASDRARTPASGRRQSARARDGRHPRREGHPSKPLRDDRLGRQPAAGGPPDDRELLGADTIEALRTTIPAPMLRQALAVFAEHVEGTVAELVDTVRGGERDEQKRLAHKLRGSSASFGATALTSVAKRIEDGGGALEQLLAELEITASATLRALRAELL
jgi:HPt (histidine-containing phosphotransfer) domain-containing protein